MATQPEFQPDTIEPQSPTELPPQQPIEPETFPSPDEAPPIGPDIDQPGRGPDETPPPLD